MQNNYKATSPWASPVVLDMSILAIFNPDQLCLLQIDVSDRGLDVVLSQISPDGEVKPAVYASVSINQESRNILLGCSVWEKSSFFPLLSLYKN